MKKILMLLAVAIFAVPAAFAQSDMSGMAGMGKTNEQNAPVELKAGETIKRGNPLAKDVKKATVAKVFASPAKFDGKTVEVNGVIVRSCKMEGCWMELADKVGGKSVRVTFNDRAFFIPLNAAGLNARAQGVFKTKTITKDEADHLEKEDGAKFSDRNADGSVTEVSFDATGVELYK